MSLDVLSTFSRRARRKLGRNRYRRNAKEETLVKRHRLATTLLYALVLVSMLAGGVMAVSARSSVATRSPHIVMLTPVDAPALQALGAHYATVDGALDADEA